MDLKKKVLEVDRRLNAAFGEKLPIMERDITHELVHAILSQNTTRRNYNLAYERLVAEFPKLEEMAKAPLAKIEKAIRPGGLSRQKATVIKGVLTTLKEDKGDYSLEFLRSYSTEDAREYLVSLKGVGPKTASVVLMFADRRKVLPVDTHVLRVSRRLGLIDSSTNAERAETELEILVPPSKRARMHLNIVRLGREVCVARGPRHEICPLNMLCKYSGNQKKGRIDQ